MSTSGAAASTQPVPGVPLEADDLRRQNTTTEDDEQDGGSPRPITPPPSGDERHARDDLDSGAFGVASQGGFASLRVPRPGAGSGGARCITRNLTTWGHARGPRVSMDARPELVSCNDRNARGRHDAACAMRAYMRAEQLVAGS